jgi:pyridoxal phosphate-dependent aminotransferase EpsN
MPRIYLSPPHMSGHELELVKDAFASNWIAPLGPHVDAFEREFAAAVGVPHAAALSSGTAALHLAMQLVGVERGDEVLCSTFTFSATANAITYEGGVPVFVDSDRASWNLDPALVAEELDACAWRNKLPRAVVTVDLYGQSADHDPIRAACERHGVTVIEDAAEALGATYKGRPCGRFGRLGVFSFNGNKIITTSGGGMLVSEDEALIRRARFLATQARDPAPHYQHSAIGYNYRLSNVLAAIGRGQLRVLDERVAARRRTFARYVELLGDLPGVAFMPEPAWSRSTRWLTCITIDPGAFGATREDVRLALEAQDIESRPLWKPMHLQPVFASCRARGGAVSAALFEDGLCLPSGSALTDAEIERIAAIVRGVCRG